MFFFAGLVMLKYGHSENDCVLCSSDYACHLRVEWFQWIEVQKIKNFQYATFTLIYILLRLQVDRFGRPPHSDSHPVHDRHGLLSLEIKISNWLFSQLYHIVPQMKNVQTMENVKSLMMKVFVNVQKIILALFVKWNHAQDRVEYLFID